MTDISSSAALTAGSAVNVSGNRVYVSGDSVRTISYGTIPIAMANIVASAGSGGTALSSGGSYINVKLRAYPGNSGVVFIGGTGANAPFSGYGLILAPNDPPTDIAVSQFGNIRICATVSGDMVSFLGIV